MGHTDHASDKENMAVDRSDDNKDPFAKLQPPAGMREAYVSKRNTLIKNASEAIREIALDELKDVFSSLADEDYNGFKVKVCISGHDYNQYFEEIDDLTLRKEILTEALNPIIRMARSKDWDVKDDGVEIKFTHYESASYSPAYSEAWAQWTLCFTPAAPRVKEKENY